MKKNFTPVSAKQLTKYSAMAAAFLAIADEADAQIVYNDIEDTTITASEEYSLFELDIDQDASTDFVFRAGSVISTSGSAWTFASIFGMYSALSAGNSVNQVIATEGSFVPYAFALDYGYLINADAAFLSNTISSNYAVLASNYFGTPYGYFGNEGEKYIGIKFNIAGSEHYGWIRVDVTLEPCTATILDCAYNATAGAAVQAGSLIEVDINDQENTSISVFSTGKTIVVNSSQLANEETMLEIFSTTGEKIYTRQLTEETSTIYLNDKASGLYLVQVSSVDNVYSKKVMLL